VLVNLQIRDFAIIDRIAVEFAPGMTVLTGETGAGKSILVDALGLVGSSTPTAGREHLSMAMPCRCNN
jgi:DNA repair protein RecN (Recombination protein N)